MLINKYAQKLIGTKVKVRSDLYEYDDCHIQGVYVYESMADKSNNIITISEIRHIDFYEGKLRIIFSSKEDGHDYTLDMLDLTYNNIDNNMQPIEKEKKDIKFKIGDLVKIKSSQDFETYEFDGDETDKTKVLQDIIQIANMSRQDLSQHTGKELVIYNIQDDIILPYYIDGEYIDNIININNVELVEENFIKNLQGKDKTLINSEEEKILDDFQTIEEMISKVDEKSYRKIIAGSLDFIPNNLHGVDINIFRWAYNKKEIYRLFNRNLSIVKEIEFNRDEYSMEIERQNLYRSFPRLLLCVKENN